MFSERLENLIKAALQDGILTEQEKAENLSHHWASCYHRSRLYRWWIARLGI